MLVACSLFVHIPLAAHADSEPGTSAQACVLMSADGQCLYEKNANSRSLIASTTKIMTAIVCLENASPDESVIIGKDACTVEGSLMELTPGESYTVRELLLGLLLSSGNDAALALAEHVGGSVDGFVRMMNQKAQSLELKDTHFANPHGLDEKGHYSTARDLARLFSSCMENPVFCDLISARSAVVRGHSLFNHNKLLSMCPGCLGGKTGYTMAAGRCLVSCCERDGLRLVCVTLSAPDDWNDHMSLYDWAYREYRLFDLSAEIDFEIPVISGSRSSIHAAPEHGKKLLLQKQVELKLVADLPRYVFAPVNAGEPAGELSILIDGKLADRCILYYRENAALAALI